MMKGCYSMAMRQATKDKLERMKEFIDNYALENMGQPPSTREIGAEFGMANVSAYRFLQKMAELGMIEYENGEIRTDVIDRISCRMEMLGTLNSEVPAGTPDMVDDAHVERYFPIPSALVNDMTGKFYMMRVKGESMVDAGIDDGDYVIFREDNLPNVDDIVVAFVMNEGNTLKRFCKDKRGPYLWAENEGWTRKERYFGRKFKVMGIVLKIIKDA